LGSAQAEGFVVYDQGNSQTVTSKVSQLLGMIDDLLMEKKLKTLLSLWMEKAVDEEYFSIPDTDTLVCSSFSASSGADSVSSQNRVTNLDTGKVATFQNWVAFLPTDGIELYFAVLMFGWQHVTNGLTTAQVHVEAIVSKLGELYIAVEHKTDFESALTWFRALNNEEKLQLFRVAFKANTVAGVMAADSVSTKDS
jgi:hypothetical protein